MNQRLVLLFALLAACDSSTPAAIPDAVQLSDSVLPPDAARAGDSGVANDAAVAGDSGGANDAAFASDSGVANDLELAADGPLIAPDLGCPTCQGGDNCCGVGCSYRDDSDCPICDPSIGVPVPLPTCSSQDPCTNLLDTYALSGITSLATPAPTAVCKTSAYYVSQGRAAYDDGPPQTWVDADGVTRSWCGYMPPGTSPASQRPLVIFIHGSGSTTSSVYDLTNLRTKAESYLLSGDPSRPGFLLVASQGRYLHWPTAAPQDGSKHDTFHRDLTTGSKNRDIAFIDHVVDWVASAGVVDTQRIYIMGWSNGARFAALYGVARHQTPTPGGQYVAAVANYSGGDPFENISHTQAPSCKLASYPVTALPLLLVSRSCDIVACNAAQDLAFQNAGVETVPGNIAGDWITTMKTTMGDPNVSWLRITAAGEPVNLCTLPSLCSHTVGVLNHLRWPDGVNDNSGNDHEPAMLDFFGQHPHP